MVTIDKKLKGSTLVEVITAMVIILTCLGIAMTIFTNLSRDVNDELRILAEIRINSLANESKRKHDFTDSNVEYDNMKIQRSILPYPAKSRLRVLFIEAFTPFDKKITEYREVVSVDTNKK